MKENYVKPIAQIFRDLFITPPDFISKQPQLGFSFAELEYVRAAVGIKYNSSEDLLEISYKNKQINICSLPMEAMKSELKHFFKNNREKTRGAE